MSWGKEIMSEKKYTNPPIQEAIFNLQVRSGGPFDENSFNEFVEKSHYTSMAPIQNVDINIETKTVSKPEITGYRCISQDSKQVVQFNKQGFSFSRLREYNGWDKNYKEALKLWQEYCQIRGVEAITRVATRFINQFHIPIFTKPEEYFNSYIKYNDQISPTWNQAFYRLLVPHSYGIKSNIVFDGKVNESDQKVNIIFDIDVFADNLGLSLEDNDSLENLFYKMRVIKNNIFEESITDQTRRLFQ